MQDSFNLNVQNQEVILPILSERKVRLFIKREDGIHPFISGNKYRKLKYNLLEAKQLDKKTILTFGGAFSNHIAAVAAAGKQLKFNTVGIIRGEELQDKISLNSTLRFAAECGMKLHFVTRAAYKNKETVKYIEYLNSQFGSFYLIPEGGTNALAVKGCEEILTEKDVDFDFITASVGTGGTISGIVNCSKLRQQVLGFPALKGEFLQNDIAKFTKKDNWRLINEYHFGGYAKTTPSLIAFINVFKQETGIALDPIYTGKMLYGILEMVKDGYFAESSSILAIHTGGLQGIEGMNTRLGLKGELTII